MSENVKSRRDLIKGIVAGSAVVGGSKALPENWSKPLTSSVVLPAHAIVSTTVGDTTFEYGDYEGGSSEYDGYGQGGPGDAEYKPGDADATAGNSPGADYEGDYYTEQYPA